MISRSSIVLTLGLLTGALLACSGGDGQPTEPEPDPNQLPEASLTASPDTGTESVDANVRLSCSDPDGSVVEWAVDLNGDDSLEVTQTNPVDTTVTYREDTGVEGRCTDDDGATAGEVVYISVTPVYQLTLRLRRFTEPGHPLVTGGDTTTFIFGSDTLTSTDSVVREVPEGWHRIHANRPGYSQRIGFVRSPDQPKFEKRFQWDAEDRPPKGMTIESNVTLDVYLWNEQDIAEATSISEETHEIDDLAQVLDYRGTEQARDPAPPPGMDKFLPQDGEPPVQPTLWYNTTESDTLDQAVIDAAEEWATTDDKNGIKYLTDGYIQPKPEVQVGGERPEEPYMEIRVVHRDSIEEGVATHQEGVKDGTNEIGWARIRLPKGREYSAHDGIFLAEATQALSGMRSDIGVSLNDNILKKESGELIYNQLARIAGTSAAWLAPGTDWQED